MIVATVNGYVTMWLVASGPIGALLGVIMEKRHRRDTPLWHGAFSQAAMYTSISLVLLTSMLSYAVYFTSLALGCGMNRGYSTETYGHLVLCPASGDYAAAVTFSVLFSITFVFLLFGLLFVWLMLYR
jgi:hypothetical protein